MGGLDRLRYWRGHKPLIGRNDQLTIALLSGLALAYLSVSTLSKSDFRGTGIDIDRADRLHVDFQIDVNRANWPELTVLPGIGATLARRMVRSRQTEGPFHNAEELVRVRGIGPGKVARIRPYLVGWVRLEGSSRAEP